ncbi:MAG TPA: hypothetical protein VGC32_07915 [Solirubrobacterales bacterium]
MALARLGLGAMFAVGVIGMLALRRVGSIRPRLLERRGGLFGFVGEAAFAFRDPGQFLRVLFQRVDATSVVDHFFAFVEQAFQVHLVPLRRGSGNKLSAAARRALHCSPMTTPAGKNAVLCASAAVVVVPVVVTEAVLKSTVVV